MAMSLTAKIWCPDNEPEPEGVFNRESCPDAPPNWFRVHPEAAAELYALERASFVVKKDGTQGRTRFSNIIHVLDDTGKLHKFKGRAGMELVAHIEALP